MNIVNARIEKWKYTADDKLRLRLLLPGWPSLEVGSRIMVMELDPTRVAITVEKAIRLATIQDCKDFFDACITEDVRNNVYIEVIGNNEEPLLAKLSLRIIDVTSKWTYSTTTWRQAPATAQAREELLKAVDRLMQTRPMGDWKLNYVKDGKVHAIKPPVDIVDGSGMHLQHVRWCDCDTGEVNFEVWEKGEPKLHDSLGGKVIETQTEFRPLPLTLTPRGSTMIIVDDPHPVNPADHARTLKWYQDAIVLHAAFEHEHFPGAVLKTVGDPRPREHIFDLFGKFTDRARKVVQLAHQEGVYQQRTELDTDLLLMGLLKEGHGIAGHVLKSFSNLDIATLRRQIEMFNGPRNPDVVITGRLPHSPAIKATMARAAEIAAEHYGHEYVGTEHLLLALTFPKNVPSTGSIEVYNSSLIFARLGITADVVRRRVEECLIPPSKNAEVLDSKTAAKITVSGTVGPFELKDAVVTINEEPAPHCKRVTVDVSGSIDPERVFGQKITGQATDMQGNPITLMGMPVVINEELSLEPVPVFGRLHCILCRSGGTCGGSNPECAAAKLPDNGEDVQPVIVGG